MAKGSNSRKKIVNTVKVEKNPVWISENNIDWMTKTKYGRLLFFYIITTPCLEKSSRGKRISDYGCDEQAFLDYLKREIGIWEASGNGTVVESRFEKAGLKSFPPTADLSERVCFSYTKDEELSYFFGHIRNSLAHGRFNICGSTKNPIVVMEDINNSDNCSARMVLSLNRLLQWIEVIEENTNNTKSAKRRK